MSATTFKVPYRAAASAAPYSREDVRQGASSESEVALPDVHWSIIRIVVLDRLTRPTPQRHFVEVHGELFAVEHEGGTVYLTHPRWSLIGSGTTLAEAQVDLIVEARQLAEVLAGIADEELDESARRLRAFAARFVQGDVLVGS